MAFFNEQINAFAILDMRRRFPVNPRTYTSRVHINNLFSNLRIFGENDVLHDVQLITLVDNREIKAHKAILAAGCEYFDNMFVRNNPDPNIVDFEIPLIRHGILKLLVRFIYTGQIQIYNEDLYSLMTAADMLLLNIIVNYCSKQFISLMCPDNVFEIYRFADDNNFYELQMASDEYVRKNFFQICNHPRLGVLTKRQVVRFINNLNQLIVDSEQQVFSAAMIWIKHDLLGRIQHVYEILSYVRMAALSVDTLLEEINSADTDKILRVPLQLINRDIAVRGVGNLVSLKPKPRLGLRSRIFIIGGGRSDVSGSYLHWDYNALSVTGSTITFDTAMNSLWFPLQPLNTSRASPAAAVLNGVIYLAGGFDRTNILPTVEIYDMELNNWSFIANMLMPRCSFGMVTLNKVLYAVGGLTGYQMVDEICNPTSSTATNMIEIYSPIMGIWAIFNRQLPEPRFNMGIVTYKNEMYIVGGRDKHNNTLRDMYSFNPLTGIFTTLSPMLIKRSNVGIAVMNKHMYVVGGIGSDREVLTMVEKYDFERDVWSYVVPMKEKRASPSVTAIDGMLYAIGGHRVLSYTQRADTPDYISISTVERYNSRTKTWEFQSNLPFSRSQAGIVAI